MCRPMMSLLTPMPCAFMRGCYRATHFRTARVFGSLPRPIARPLHCYCQRNIDLTAADNTVKLLSAAHNAAANFNARSIGVTSLTGTLLPKKSPSSPPAMILFDPSQGEKR